MCFGFFFFDQWRREKEAKRNHPTAIAEVQLQHGVNN
jgi:translation initiation factor IF-3